MRGFIHKSFRDVKISGMIAQNDDQNASMILHNLLLTLHTHAGIQKLCVTKPQKDIY